MSRSIKEVKRLINSPTSYFFVLIVYISVPLLTELSLNKLLKPFFYYSTLKLLLMSENQLDGDVSFLIVVLTGVVQSKHS